MTKNSILTIFAVFLSLSSCKTSTELKTQGLKSFPDAQKFERLFSQNHHSVGRYGGPGEPLMWMSKGLVHDRYCIQLAFDLEKSISGTISKSAPLDIIIWEHSYGADPDGSKTWLRGSIAKLTEAQWAKVKTVDDIFTLAGVVPITNQPIAELKTKSPEDW